MKIYKAGILGCGPRASYHARVYSEIPNMQLTACCDLSEERRTTLREQFTIPHVYADYLEMLEAEGLDVVHLVTQPDYRVVPIHMAAEAGARAVIVEKPFAILPSEAEAISKIVEETGLKVLVNHQRRYFDHAAPLRDAVANKIGTVQFVRASTKGNLIAMGPHLMDLLLMMLDDPEPTAVWATAFGFNTEGYESTHRAPANTMATYEFASGLRVFFEATPLALGTWDETGFWMHLHMDFWGSDGWAWQEQNRFWGYQTRSMAEPVIGHTSWEGQELAGQRDFTAAVATWLDDPEQPHLNRYELSKRGFDALMAACKSALLGQRIELPTTVTDDEILALHRRLAEDG